MVGCKVFMAQRNYDYETHNRAGERISKETEEEWKNRVLDEWSSLNFDKMAMIFHEFDYLPNGSPKPLHAHCVIIFETPKTKEAVMKHLKCSLESNVQPVRSLYSASRYLTHITEQAILDKKFIYSQRDVYTFNCSYNDLIQKQ